MQLVNLQGTSIFGAGSEWFWTMGQFVVVVATVFGIYRQLRAQGAANALARIETLHRRYDSREMHLAKLTIALQLRQGRSLSTMVLRVDTVIGFFETLYDLYVAGFMPLQEIDSRFGGGVQIWWRLLRSFTEEGRREESDPLLGAGLEKLEELCDRVSRDRGAPRAWITEGPVTALLDAMIARATDRLELLNDVEGNAIPRLPKSNLPNVVDLS